jgi:hypothetical protein
MTQKEKDKLALEVSTISQNLIIAYEKNNWDYVLEQSKRLVYLKTEINKIR